MTDAPDQHTESDALGEAYEDLLDTLMDGLEDMVAAGQIPEHYSVAVIIDHVFSTRLMVGGCDAPIHVQRFGRAIEGLADRLEQEAGQPDRAVH